MTVCAHRYSHYLLIYNAFQIAQKSKNFIFVYIGEGMETKKKIKSHRQKIKM